MVDLPGYGYAKVSRDMKDDWQKHLGHYLNNHQGRLYSQEFPEGHLQ